MRISLAIAFVLFFFVSSARSVEINPTPPIYKTFSVDTSFVQDAFYDREILEFSFVKGEWELEFDMASRSFRPITDLLQIVTNLPASDIDSETYHLTMAINQSSCRTGGGELGSKDFASVFVNVDGTLEEVSEAGVDIGGGALSFQEAGRTGLYAEHEVTLKFAPVELGVDTRCVGVVRMQMELGI
ncbi:hypothetical protein [Vibrio parahaemolyticus]|uniref:hypothetical protein n=1 Tax=Vibrio parahaemolyticus TaxID=670 RepID=UPI00067A8315|nr:hypothetical protein [Vibrio parahaemolyticus]